MFLPLQPKSSCEPLGVVHGEKRNLLSAQITERWNNWFGEEPNPNFVSDLIDTNCWIDENGETGENLTGSRFTIFPDWLIFAHLSHIGIDISTEITKAYSE